MLYVLDYCGRYFKYTCVFLIVDKTHISLLLKQFIAYIQTQFHLTLKLFDPIMVLSSLIKIFTFTACLCESSTYPSAK